MVGKTGHGFGCITVSPLHILQGKFNLLLYIVILPVFTSIYIYVHSYELQFKSTCFALILWKLPRLDISKTNAEKHGID